MAISVVSIGEIATGFKTAPFLAAYPATVNAGDLLIGMSCVDVNSGSPTWDAAEGFTSIYDSAESSNIFVDALWKTAVGTETGNFNINSGSGAGQAATIIIGLTGAADPSVDPPEIATTSTFVGTNPDPPSITPSWGDAGITIACFGSDGNENVTVWPTGYTDSQTRVQGGGCTMVAAINPTPSSPENPSAFTIGSSENGFAFTIAVKADAAAGGGISRLYVAHVAGSGRMLRSG